VGRLLDVETGDLRDGHVLTGEVLLRPRDRIELAASISGLRLVALDGGAPIATENDESFTAIYHFTAALDVRVQGVSSDAARNEPAHTTGQSATTQEWTVFAKWTGAMGN
jgi:hypothetical protein